ncbi:MAG: hypothetical protein CVU59_10185 [Deltaproteobacteria bacterium HGW-Deltaproteobacteria-17]|nr:MAG: hypothetical protein CVU59_10185 [Deltaproteobacteria bacterium HGW-Deltaproteobacteria-17]
MKKLFIFVLFIALGCAKSTNLAGEKCTDGKDNDGDGLVDCDDPDCVEDASCQAAMEICDDHQDNDGDSWVDCDDPDCYASAVCTASGEICNDRIDNDDDSLVDCDDPDCSTSAICAPDDEVCDDTIDNDGDGYVDCDDMDCTADIHCEQATETACNDLVDNDHDGLTDCTDPDCYEDLGCVRCNDQFTDVPTSHWAFDDIRALYVNGIVNGCSASPLMYCPASTMPRKFLAVMLINALGETPSSAGLNQYFSDTTDPVTTAAANRLYELGITTGCGTGIFCPDAVTLRRDAVTFIVRALGLTLSTAAADAYFDDVSGYSVPYINTAFEHGIAQGCGARLFCPDADLNRDAAAVFTARGFGITDAFCGL